MKYYIISGEASGDLHGSNLIRSLQTLDAEADFRCWGGDLMRQAGATVVKHYRDLAFMGFVEVAAHLGTILRNMRFCRRDIKAYRPDVVILIDYPGFNMPMARFAHRQGFKVVYYIAPQVWAWRTGRIKKLKRYVDQIYTLLPFEHKFYEAYGATVRFEGNPLVDAIAAYRPDEEFIARYRNSEDKRPLVVILPGSRKQEIKHIFPVMLRAAARMPQYRYVVAGTHTLSEELYRSYLRDYPEIEWVCGHTYDLFSLARAGMVKSGTSTLEAALFSMPQVVCYRTTPATYRIGRLLVNKEVRFISLVNLIMDKEVVTELLQNDLNEARLVSELEKVAEDTGFRKNQKKYYTELQEVIGLPGISDRVADSIISEFKRL
ncbi:MAG: lipid-A-disaccharide synthase [Bacteroidales bacterium]|nr:lipid-A-disaccharide synthase [Bacteroidales bacterium]